MKNITITGEWLNAMTDTRARRYFLRDLFELADVNEWTIRVKGAHYGQA